MIYRNKASGRVKSFEGLRAVLSANGTGYAAAFIG